MSDNVTTAIIQKHLASINYTSIKQVVRSRYLLAQLTHYIISYEIVKTESKDADDKELKPNGAT